MANSNIIQKQLNHWQQTSEFSLTMPEWILRMRINIQTNFLHDIIPLPLPNVQRRSAVSKLISTHKNTQVL